MIGDFYQLLQHWIVREKTYMITVGHEKEISEVRSQQCCEYC